MFEDTGPNANRRRWAVLLLVLSLTACGVEEGVPNPLPDSATGMAAVYSAVIREIYTKDSSFGGNPPFDTLYVVDHTTSQVRDLGSEGTPFDEETLELIIEGLGDLPPIVVVGRGSEVLDSEGTVIDNGAVIQLGPMVSAGERFTVLAMFYVGGDGAATVEYLIDEGVTGWDVAGATGTTTVS